MYLCNNRIVPNEYRTFFEQLPHEPEDPEVEDEK
jgi:hypothetical protein